ncbi:threonine ammonia-lyase [Minwuia thermotolerans]|uniref:Serine/threonine dehydratase n=1 Tax=Minwuia thermotolerans TaxID=2056226 RepID=A0A2M9FWL4_9PROT|nr:threonine/serine dehydratase [Minwuia thermotolerans]PJK27844.1 serine/threonine dehydratase [Minwuia thermotolerans]
MTDVTLADIEAAADRIRGAVRRTPLFRPDPVAGRQAGCALHLKLENLQLAGSFKARGAANTALSLPPEELRRGLVTASGGNHGLGVAAAAKAAGIPAAIYLSSNATPDKISRLESFGAEVIVEGEVWDDANALALARAERDGRTYVHPFAQASVIAGQGTVALELLEDLPDVETVAIAIGGGGLISGVATALKARNPSIRIIGVEAEGAPTLKRSRDAGELITLEKITTRVATLAPRRSAQINLDIVSRLVDDIVLVSDEEMIDAARWLWSQCAIAAEMAGAAGLAAVLQRRFPCRADEKVGVLVCGAGTDGMPR